MKKGLTAICVGLVLIMVSCSGCIGNYWASDLNEDIGRDRANSNGKS